MRISDWSSDVCSSDLDGAHYDTWYNGNLRSISYFHNAIGILTETIGKPVPIDIELVPERQLPGNNQPAPIAPQKWHIGQSLEYSMTINRAVRGNATATRDRQADVKGKGGAGRANHGGRRTYQ